MPPKKSQKKAETSTDTPMKANGTSTASNTSKKRKDAPTATEAAKPVRKEPRTGSRASSRNKPSSSSATPKQLFTYLLSPDCLPHCYPEDELSAAKEHASDKNYRTYSSTAPTRFHAFENLVIASILSKPLSHRLGLRTVRTLLNNPFGLGTAGSIVAAGEHRVWEAMEAARTQHRQKTAAFLHQMACTVRDEKWGDDLSGLPSDFEEMRRVLKARMKGLGDTGIDIYCRRDQCDWPEWFADGKSLDAMRQLGVDVQDAEELKQLMSEEVDWSKYKDVMKHDATSGIESKGAQVAFVLVLERALGCALEGKVSELVKAAAEAG